MLKIWRSPKSRFGIHVEHPDELLDETITAERSYTDDELRTIAADNFNAVWIHARLEHLIPHARFPEFAPHSQWHLDALHRLAARAEKFGIKLCLYLQPPRGIPVSDVAFWAAHADVGGQVVESYGDDGSRFMVRSLCTSTPEVQAYLRDAFAELVRQLPELGAIIIISASEYPAHCYSNRNCRPGVPRPRKMVMPQVPTDCPRCGKKEPEEIVIALLNAIRDGVRSVSPSMPLIFWNWSWTMYLDPPCEEIISKLPRDVTLMIDFERGGVRRDGTRIDEYSLGFPGPSAQFLSVAATAKKYNIPVMPKFQLGTTHELATVRSLPIIPSLFAKARYVRNSGAPGFMGCWNFGNLTSTSLRAFDFFLRTPENLSCEEALYAFAEHAYPDREADKVIRAWNLFAEAMESYPFTIHFLYNGAVNLALGITPHPGVLDGRVIGRSFLPDERGDSLAESETPEFPLPQIIERLEKMAQLWDQGSALLKAALGDGHPDFINAAVCGACWRSAFHLYSIYALRKNWDDSKLAEYGKLAAAELRLVQSILPCVEADPEEGHHLEGDFFAFSKEILRRKIDELQSQTAQGNRLGKIIPR